MTASQAQTWLADRYQRNAGFVAELGRPVIGWLAPRPGERVLDLGCGDGALTAELAATGAVVTGADAAPDQIAACRARGLDAHVVDATALSAHPVIGARRFDAVVSNAALHWMRPPETVAAEVLARLEPGGRFVAEMGGHGNVAAITTALLAVLEVRGIDGRPRIPWTFPTPEAHAAVLTRAGFEVVRTEVIPRPTVLPGALEAWLETFAEPFLAGLDAEAQSAVRRDVAALLAPSLRTEAGVWIADYVRLRFEARRPR